MKTKVILSCVSVALLFTSCATILSGRTAKVTLKNEDVKVPVTLTYNDSKKVEHVYLPCTIKVKRGVKPTIIQASAPGYYDENIFISKKLNHTFWWNILAGGIIGIGVDAATGALMKPEKKEYRIPFREAYATTQTETVTPAWQEPIIPNQEIVSSGNTIKCIFDSEPQGARIFWRIISSVPEEVENTNELWLGITPFNEARSFNITGLTEKNAQDIQIEVKVKMKGYADQTKRFNVKQAIEQKEISNFFDMVKE